MSDKSLVSLIIPCYNEEKVIPLLLAALDPVLEALSKRYNLEVILVDDGSTDQTWELLIERTERNPLYRAVSLSRNFGHQQALTCGYDLAQGDAVISMDADLQDPPDVLPRLLNEWENGADVVHAVRIRREGESWFKRFTARTFYRLLRQLGAPNVTLDAGDFRLLSRRGLEALRSLREHHRYIRGMVGWIGFRTATVPYARAPRKAGRTKYPFRKMAQLAADAIFSLSIRPLRLTFVLATILAGIFVLFLGYSFGSWLLFDTVLIRGWTSLILAVVGLGVLNLICIGIVGEYVGRLFEQSKGRPLYILREESTIKTESPKNRIVS